MTQRSAVMNPADADRAFIDGTSPLRPENAAAAMIQPARGQYLMQLRDPLENIFFPGHWGMFGGAVDAGESAFETLRRELNEELELQISEDEVEFFTRLDLDFSFAGHGKVWRDFYSVSIEEQQVSELRLHEGAALAVFSAEEILLDPRVTPYDRWAIWLNESKDRLALSSGSSQDDRSGQPSKTFTDK